MELIKQVEINIDYIIMLIRKYHDGHLKDKEIIVSIGKSIDASLELRNKKDLIENFITSLTPTSCIDDDWSEFVKLKKLEELNQIIADENLDKEKAYKFVQSACQDGFIQGSGTAVGEMLPPMSRFTSAGERTQKRETVMEKLVAFFNRFRDLN